MASPHPPPEAQIPGPPYPPTTAGSGGIPTLTTDVPIAAVFLVLFIGAAIGHMTIFQINRRRGHKFILSGMMFGFCMARIVTMVMRIVWANYPHDVQVAIAAMIFTTAGVILLFAINAVFTERVLRSTHPRIGWSKPVSIFFIVILALIVVCLAMVITTTVQSFYTLNPNTKLIDRDVQLSVSTYFLFIAFLPLPVVTLAVATPRKEHRPLDNFGAGHWRLKVGVLLTTAALLTTGAGFRTGTLFMPLRPIDDPAWYHSKSCYWIFNFVIEIIVIYLYIAVRVDHRFHIPNHAKGSYNGPQKKEMPPWKRHEHAHEATEAPVAADEKSSVSGEEGDGAKLAKTTSAWSRLSERILPEEQVFYGDTGKVLQASEDVETGVTEK